MKERTEKQKQHLRELHIGNIGRKPSDKQLEALSGGRKLPKSLIQIESARELCRELGKRPKTEVQINQCRRLGELPRSEKQLANSFKAQSFGPDTVKHHNDLCHGELKPNDITLMTHSEHNSFHQRLLVENGTHPWLRENRMK